MIKYLPKYGVENNSNFHFFFRRCQAAITEEEKSQVMASSYQQLIEARKENVALQLEAAYRERLQQAYDQVSAPLFFDS